MANSQWWNFVSDIITKCGVSSLIYQISDSLGALPGGSDCEVGERSHCQAWSTSPPSVRQPAAKSADPVGLRR